jgi:hypothetical protein
MAPGDMVSLVFTELKVLQTLGALCGALGALLLAGVMGGIPRTAIADGSCGRGMGRGPDGGVLPTASLLI